MRRTIVFGDVHGCLFELKALLRKVRARPEDRLISVGDLICKGPDSKGVLDWAMRARNLRCVLGNHEYRYLQYWKRGLTPDQKPYDLETVHQLGGGFDRYMRFIRRWPLFIKGKDWLVVHAGFDPRTPLSRQSKWELTNIRRIGAGETPWYESYEKKAPLVVFGHWVHREPILRDNAVGLDTGCVYGGRLTALILPERRLLSVRARKVYRRKESWK